jgi:antitoxin HicB
MLQYPLTLEEDDNGTVLVDFPDIPEAHSVGDDITAALANALDAFETVFDLYVEDSRPLPVPSVASGGPTLVVPIELAERIQHWNAQFPTAT